MDEFAPSVPTKAEGKQESLREKPSTFFEFAVIRFAVSCLALRGRNTWCYPPSPSVFPQDMPAQGRDWLLLDEIYRSVRSEVFLVPLGKHKKTYETGGS